MAVPLALFALFQNCSNNYKLTTEPAASNLSTTAKIVSGSVNVDASRPNPPLDLFFIIDNSASMLGHQINLGNAFASVFQSNSANLSNFDVNIYVFSTASTVNASYVSQIPAPLTSVPSPFPAASATASLAAVPGSIFGFSDVATGVYGTAPFSDQYAPAPVLALASASGAVVDHLHIPAQGSLSSSDYQSQIATLTQDFQSRLAYLNPTDQLAYQSLTDISSGLCSVARILRHSSNFIQPGDSAAFVIVSDDNDRLNDRNPNNSQCVEADSSTSEVVDGTCGHYETTFSYDATASLTYQSDSKFNYQSGTKVTYTYPGTTTETCAFTYTTGFDYTDTYTQTQPQTIVTYTLCNQMADGTCISETPNTTVTVSGSYAGAGGSCTQDMTSLVTTPAPGTSFSCAATQKVTQGQGHGVDTNSSGSSCSNQLLSQLSSNPEYSNITCTITGANTVTGTASGQASGSCASYCSSHSTQYPGCVLTSTTPTTSTKQGSFTLNLPGWTCSSTCPNSTQCGTGTIGQYITSTYGASATCSVSTVLRRSPSTRRRPPRDPRSHAAAASAISPFTTQAIRSFAPVRPPFNLVSPLSPWAHP